MTLPADIRINIGASFPARVSGSSYIVVVKSNGVWTIEPDWSLLQSLNSISNPSVKEVVVYDPSTGTFSTVTISALIGNTRSPVNDAAYTVLATDRNVAFTVLTAARIATLPAASAFPTGTLLRIFDESASCSSTNTITITAAGSDKINGSATNVIETAYGHASLQSDGVSKWTVV